MTWSKYWSQLPTRASSPRLGPRVWRGASGFLSNGGRGVPGEAKPPEACQALGEAKVVCVVDISYSDIGVGRAKLRRSSAIGRSLIVGAAMSRSRTNHPHDMDVSYQRLTTIRVALVVCADFTFSPAAILDLGASKALLEWHRPCCASRAIPAAAEWARRDRTTVAWSLHGSLLPQGQGRGVHDAYRR